MDWLEPSLEKGVDKVFGACIDSERFIEINKKFMIILNDLNENFRIGSKFPELENLFLSASALSIEYSYRKGFEDAMNIYSTYKK